MDGDAYLVMAYSEFTSLKGSKVSSNKEAQHRVSIHLSIIKSRIPLKQMSVSQNSVNFLVPESWCCRDF